MMNCSQCNCFQTCQNSGFDMQFITRVAISLSTTNTDVAASIHQYEAKQLGYNLEEILKHIKTNAKECIYFNF